MVYLTEWHRTIKSVSGYVWYDDVYPDGTFVEFVPTRIDNMNVWVNDDLYVLHGNPRHVSQVFANQTPCTI